MTYVFVNRPTVRRDILEAIDYYKKYLPSLLNFF